jgi:hypothetical protein
MFSTGRRLKGCARVAQLTKRSFRERKGKLGEYHKTQISMKYLLKLIALAVVFLTINSRVFAQGTAFTYQGRLDDSGSAANGSYDLQFAAFDNLTNGIQQGPTLTQTAIGVTNGLFTVTLDFGYIYPGPSRYLEIGVRTNGTSGFTTLAPRQPLSATPYAVTAGNLVGSGLAGIYGGAITLSNAANQITGTFSGSGVNLTNINATTINGVGSAMLWKTTGNIGTVPGTSYLGTADTRPLEFKVNATRALRLEPTTSTNLAVNVIGGSATNYVVAGIVGATIAGGGAIDTNFAYGSPIPNHVDAIYGTVGGGAGNSATSNFSTVIGGLVSSASGIGSIAGGIATDAKGFCSVALGYQSTAGGDYSTATGNSYAYGRYSCAFGEGDVTGEDSMAVGLTTCDGNFSFIGGSYGYCGYDGSFVWADILSPYGFGPTSSNMFVVHAAGGFGIGTASPSCQLEVDSTTTNTPQVLISQGNANDYARFRMRNGGNYFWEMDVSTGITPSLSFWNASQRVSFDYNGNITAKSFVTSSDRNLKENIQPVSAQEMLDKVASLPITHWNFKDDAGTKHVGPMAQDFYAAFGIGPDDKHIATVDEDGVALAAIQGLNQKVDAKDAEIGELKKQNDALGKRLNELEMAVKALAARK